jgi:hypothetical protein
MHRTSRVIITTALAMVVSVHGIMAQAPPGVWKRFAERVSVGTELNVHLTDGRRVRATLVGVVDDAVLLQPKTRIPVPVQAVPYAAIVRMEPRKAGHSTGRAVALGAATGVGVFFGVMMALLAAVAD